MSLLPRPCITCGDLTDASHCAEHTPRPPDRRRGRGRDHVGRGAAWDRLSRRARSFQDWCTDCGSRDDLTADHLPSAWHKVIKHRALTLHDVEVVCRSCNSRRGPAQPGSQRYVAWLAEQDQEALRGVSEATLGVSAPGVSPTPGISRVT